MIESARPLRVQLREETRAVHEATHELPVLRCLARSVIGRAEYAELLLRLEAFYAAIDTVLAAACKRHAASIGGAVHAARAPLLARDLAGLGLLPARAEAPAMPLLDGAAAIAGMFYVVDGALLGGATLGRAVRRLDWPAPCVFWSWCQAEGPAIWHRTLALIDHVDRGPDSRAGALATASATFSTFADWMGQLSPEPAK